VDSGCRLHLAFRSKIFLLAPLAFLHDFGLFAARGLLDTRQHNGVQKIFWDGDDDATCPGRPHWTIQQMELLLDGGPLELAPSNDDKKNTLPRTLRCAASP